MGGGPRSGRCIVVMTARLPRAGNGGDARDIARKSSYLFRFLFHYGYTNESSYLQYLYWEETTSAAKKMGGDAGGFGGGRQRASENLQCTILQPLAFWP